MPFPFEVGFDEVQSNLDEYVDAVFGCLESEFLVMPKGTGFVEFSKFETGYEALKRATGSFQDDQSGEGSPAVFEVPISLVVLRCMLGFTPPEWAYYASRHTGVAVTQGAARAVDRKIRTKPEATLPRNGGVTERRIHALIATACHILQSGAPATSPGELHRFDKADTRAGLVSLQSTAGLGVPYSHFALRAPSRSAVCRPSGFHQRVGGQHCRERH